jgi:hypothetical protein
MNIIKILRKPYLAILLASLTLFASCSQYDSETINNGLDEQTKAQLKQATIEFVNNVKNNPESLNKTTKDNYTGIEDTLINEALSTYVNNDLEIYRANVISFSQWNNNQLNAIEAIFIVLETVKDNFTAEDAKKVNLNMSKQAAKGGGAWWAPLGFWGVCTVVGVLTVGIAGIACAGLIAARVSYLNYQNQ